jgi:hypothetical protein
MSDRHDRDTVRPNERYPTPDSLRDTGATEFGAVERSAFSRCAVHHLGDPEPNARSIGQSHGTGDLDIIDAGAVV